MRPRLLMLCLAALVAGCEGSIAEERLQVLITNDDGVAAPGIAALVDELAANPALDLVVIAPDGNRSGSGDQYTTTVMQVRPASTVSGFPAKSVSGFPADGPLFGILHDLPEPPDLVVSGINEGQNIGELTTISGTVGAALWSARLDVPALAFSQGLPAPDYSEAARYAADIVERFRTDADFRARMRSDIPGRAMIVNVNFPTCSTGSTRGVRVVPIGRVVQPVGYEVTAQEGDATTVTPIMERATVFASDCTSALTDPSNDVEAMIHGFASVTPMNSDLTAASLDDFKFLAR
jgi:5'-nucleotidase